MASKYWENDFAKLLRAVEDAIKSSPSDTPANDEPYALVGDGSCYWRLRHAWETICGPLDFDGTARVEGRANIGEKHDNEGSGGDGT